MEDVHLLCGEKDKDKSGKLLVRISVNCNFFLYLCSPQTELKVGQLSVPSNF